MRHFIPLLFFIILTAIGILFVKDMKSAPTITFFPIDYKTSFESTNTSLEFSHNTGKDFYNVKWDVQSMSEIPMYLRQDVSLLFTDGELYGMRSKWRENTDTISFSESTTGKSTMKWEAISFHYGEVHKGKNINSIQGLSYDKLYVFKENNHFKAFKNQQVDRNNKLKEMLDMEINKRLFSHWQNLLFYFHINVEDYYAFPLTSLYLYQHSTFPNMDQEHTDRVMGQLWEGLYKNYIIPNIDSKKKLESYIPLILIEKNGDNLLVLYEINGQKEKLIQKTGD